MQNTMVLGENKDVVLRILSLLIIWGSAKLGPSLSDIPKMILCYQIKDQVVIPDFV